jgi:hypothetical protein
VRLPGPPKIIRLHGTGEAVLPGDARFDDLLAGWDFESIGPAESRRAVVRVDVERVSQSCGYGVPLMEVEGEREHYELSVSKKLRTKGPEAAVAAMRERNTSSIDGLPALPGA